MIKAIMVKYIHHYGRDYYGDLELEDSEIVDSYILEYESHKALQADQDALRLGGPSDEGHPLYSLSQLYERDKAQDIIRLAHISMKKKEAAKLAKKVAAEKRKKTMEAKKESTRMARLAAELGIPVSELKKLQAKTKI